MSLSGIVISLFSLFLFIFAFLDNNYTANELSNLSATRYIYINSWHSATN